MIRCREVIGVLEVVFSWKKGLVWLVCLISGWWPDPWAKFYDKRFSLSPLWARVLGTISSLVTHPAILILIAVYFIYPLLS